MSRIRLVPKFVPQIGSESKRFRRKVPTVSDLWMLQERKLIETFGLDVWGHHDPKFFSDLSNREIQNAHSDKERSRLWLSVLKAQGVLGFRPNQIIFNRYLRLLVDEQNKIVIHDKLPGNFERKIYKTFGWTFFCVEKANWQNSLNNVALALKKRKKDE